MNRFIRYFHIGRLSAVLLLMGLLCGTVLAAVPASPYAKRVRRTSSGMTYVRIRVKKQKDETCNPTSMSMILNYYGIFVSPEKLQKASSGTDAYKYSYYLAGELAKYKMKMIFLPMSAGRQAVFQCVVRSLNCGIPLQWLVDLRKAPDYDIPPRQKAQIPQGRSGHARIINGFKVNRKNRRLTGFMYADPWGERRQEIRLEDVDPMTHGFFLVFPEKTDKRLLQFILAPLNRKKK